MNHNPLPGFVAALRAELFVARHSLAARVTLLLPALIAALQLLLVSLRTTGEQAREALFGGSNDFAMDNAWGYFVDGLLTGITMLALTLVVYTAWSFASDRDSGALRHLLIRRSSRRSVVMAKFISASLLALLALLLLMAVATGLSALLWQFGPVVEDGYELIGSDEIREEVALGLRLALLPLPAAIAFGLLVAVSTQSTAQSMTVALGLTLALDVFKGSMGVVGDYLYVRYLPSLLDQSYLSEVSRLVRGYSDVLLDPQLLTLNQWLPLPQMLLLLTIALLIIGRRKL